MNGKRNTYPSQCCVKKTAVRLVDHSLTLGRRQAIAGVEYSLAEMKVGGYRKARLSPHLAYRDQGLDGLIPANSVLVVELWLRGIVTG